MIVFDICKRFQVTVFADGSRADVTVTSSTPLAKGASAVVLRGEMCEGQGFRTRQVALKIFPAAAVLTDASRELVRRELFAASQLRHERLISCIGTAVVGSQAILVTPFMANGNLLQYLKAHPSSDRGHFLWQVADALRFLHDDAGLVHGDIKCENVLVSDTRDAVLADFGLSTLVEQAASDLTTATEIRCYGTLRFMAPELFDESLLNDETTTHETDRTNRVRSKTRASDVYAFGMLVLQAFTGSRPWMNIHRDIDIVLRVIKGQRPPWPGDQRMQDDFTSFYWTGICNECWRFRPRERPHVREMYLLIKRHHDGKGLELACEVEYGHPRYLTKVYRSVGSSSIWQLNGIAYCSVVFDNSTQEGTLVARCASSSAEVLARHGIQRKHKYQCLRDDLICWVDVDGSACTLVFKDTAGRDDVLKRARRIQSLMAYKANGLKLLESIQAQEPQDPFSNHLHPHRTPGLLPA